MGPTARLTTYRTDLWQNDCQFLVIEVVGGAEHPATRAVADRRFGQRRQ